jgi:3-oxoacyl-[acyl-carrier protein] reductase
LVNALDFLGRTAVVTGGAAGIGLAVAQRLAASGATVALWDRDDAALVEAKASLPDTTRTQVVEVADASAVGRAADAAIRDLGQIDVLVCSAGITGPNVSTWNYPVEAWRQVIDVNLNGVFHCNRAIVPSMLRNDYGRIVNIASVAGKEGNPTLRRTARRRRRDRTHQIAREGAGGDECASQLRDARAVRTAIFDQMTQQHIDFMLSKIPMGRFGTVAEVAALICWLASEECSFSTGAVFDVSGGRATY